MLWYKAWLETRARFLASVSTLALSCGLFVHHALTIMQPEWNAAFNRLLYITQDFLAIIWILCAVLLGMGGIVHEKTVGTSSFTLSLPVSRTRLQVVRVGVGLLEAVLLAVVPWIVICAISWRAQIPVRVAHVGLYPWLLVCGGLVYYAMAVLVSSLVEGEYSGPAIAIGLVFLSTIILDSWFRRLDVWRFATGDLYVDKKTFELTAHIPWLGTRLCIGAATLMLVASTRAVQCHEF